MDKSSNILFKQLINKFLSTKNDLPENINPEFEIKFGTNKIKNISKINFDNIGQILLSKGFILKNNINLLRITSNDIRTEIIGLKNIQDYCKNNKLPLDSPDFSKFINFMEKKTYDDEKNNIVNYNEFNFKATYNKEEILSISSEKIKTLLETWETNKKFYRLINRN